MTVASPRTEPDPPVPALADLLWQLAPHLPGVLLRTAHGAAQVSALGPISVHAWPGESGRVQAFPSHASALALLIVEALHAQGASVQVWAEPAGWGAAVRLASAEAWTWDDRSREGLNFPALHVVASAALRAFQARPGAGA